MRETHKIEKKVSRFVILMMIGFMLGRVWIGAVNPFALAFLGGYVHFDGRKSSD